MRNDFELLILDEFLEDCAFKRKKEGGTNVWGGR